VTPLCHFHIRFASFNSMMKTRLTVLSLAFAAALALGGCATPARVEQMIAQPAPASAPLASPAMRGNIAVRDVTGGKDTNPMWMSNVGTSAFEGALEQSLRAAGLLSENRQGGRYFIIADLVNLDQPYFGASMTVTATVRYTLVERSTSQSVYSKSIVAPYTAQWNDAFVGTERLRLANEGAIKANITKLMDDLLQLKVTSAGSQ
jgi:hypothetical protein